MPKPITHALDLPEIVFRISEYMDGADILACSAVSKDFHTTFGPLVWDDLYIGQPISTVLESIREQKPQARFVSFNTCCSGKNKTLSVDDDQREHHPLQEDQVELLEVLRYNAHHVRSLSFLVHEFADQLSLGRGCSHVESLFIEALPFVESSGSNYWNACKKLLWQNRASLRSLSLKHWALGQFKRPERGEPLWNPILSCTRHMSLRSLSIKESRIRGRHLRAFWEICERLEILELEQVALDLTVTVNESRARRSRVAATRRQDNIDMRFPKLRKLTLSKFSGANPIRQLELLIGHCPVIRSLVWVLNPNMYFPTAEFCDLFQKQTWWYLHSLVIKGHRGWVDERTCNTLLETAPQPFRMLDLKVWIIKPSTFELFRQRHFSVITTIDLTSAIQQSADTNLLATGVPQFVQEVLESCPALEHITAKTVTAKLMLTGKPWICHRLKEFNVMIDMELPTDWTEQWGARLRAHDIHIKEKKQQCRAVYERLSRLRQLRVLNLHLDCWHPSDAVKLVSLPFEVSMGLGLLAPLKRIEKVGFHGAQDMHRRDIEWMVDHWPRLKTVVAGERFSYKKEHPKSIMFERDHCLLRLLLRYGVKTARRFPLTNWDMRAATEVRLGSLELSDSADENEDDNDE